MKHFSLNLEAMSPLAIRSDHAAGGAGSAGYISGTALAGSLAAVHRLYNPGDSATFEQLFLSGEVQYPDLYPATFRSERILTEKEKQEANALPVYSLPKTAQSCKRFPGFPYITGEEIDDPRHGVRDSLLDWAIFELGNKANEANKASEAGHVITTTVLLKLLQDHKKCPNCEKPMEHFTGFYRRGKVDSRMMKAEVDNHKRLQTHTGINRATGTVQEGILYNRQVFEEHMRFWGLVKLPEELVKPFGDFIEQVGQSGLLRIGTGRTRGLGKVHLSVEPLEDEQAGFDKFKTRLREFDTLLRLQAIKAFDEDFQAYLKPFYFALTLHSPAILPDKLLRYRGTIDKQALVELLDMPADSADTFELIYQAASTRRVTGWNELWGLPRTNEYAIDTGSVFLFACDDEQVDPLKQALFRLEEKGIGQRRSEGFGRVCISDPFHQEVELK